MTKVNFNNNLNGIEVIFAAKPEPATIEALKANGFKWHNVKKLWYAKQTPARVAFAQSLGSIEAQPETQPTAKTINLDGLGENKPHLWGAELSKAIRDDLKNRGVDGVRVRMGRGGYTTSIYVTVKATAADLASIEEAKERFNLSAFACEVQTRNVYINNKWLNYSDFENMTQEEKEKAHTDYIIYSIKHLHSFNHYHTDRRYYWEFTAAFYNKVLAVCKIANQWNYDNSDIMTDYFDVGYYLNIDIETTDEEPRETMTETERAGLIQEREEEARAHAEALKAYEEQRKKDEEARAKYNAWHEEARANIENNITVEELENALYITELAGGIGKEASFAELLETINETDRPKHEARATVKVTFKTAAALDDFNKLYMDDFEFLAGKGGTASEDVRLLNCDFYKLTKEQRDTIKLYNNECVAVYLDNILKLVINPEGYATARYVYIPTEATEIKDAAEELKRQEEESKSKPAFYIPAPIEEQAEALKIGDAVTIYKCDGWILCNIYAGAGVIVNKYAGNYAQYKGVWLELLNNKKVYKVFIRDNNETLIYKGIFDKLPEEVTSREICPNMRELLNYNELLPATYKYYKAQGIAPILDTCPR